MARLLQGRTKPSPVKKSVKALPRSISSELEKVKSILCTLDKQPATVKELVASLTLVEANAYKLINALNETPSLVYIASWKAEVNSPWAAVWAVGFCKPNVPKPKKPTKKVVMK